MAKKRKATPPLRMGARATTYRPGFKPGSAGHETWKWEFSVLPNPEANEAIAEYLTRHTVVELKTQLRELPGYTEKQWVYTLDNSLMKLVESSHNLRGKYKAFVRRTEGGGLYRHHSPEQLEAAKIRRTKKLVKRATRKGAGS